MFYSLAHYLVPTHLMHDTIVIHLFGSFLKQTFNIVYGLRKKHIPDAHNFIVNVVLKHTIINAPITEVYRLYLHHRVRQGKIWTFRQHGYEYDITIRKKAHDMLIYHNNIT